MDWDFYGDYQGSAGAWLEGEYNAQFDIGRIYAENNFCYGWTAARPVST